MRIVDRVYHDVSPSELDGHETETAHVQLYSGNPMEQRPLQSGMACARLAFASQAMTDRRDRIASQVHPEVRPPGYCPGCCHASSKVSPFVVKRWVLVASGWACMWSASTWSAVRNFVDKANMCVAPMLIIWFEATCLIWMRPRLTKLWRRQRVLRLLAVSVGDAPRTECETNDCEPECAR
jgi:hypothetical protein